MIVIQGLCTFVGVAAGRSKRLSVTLSCDLKYEFLHFILSSSSPYNRKNLYSLRK